MLKYIGNYEIIRQVGKGAMGVVYESVQEGLHRKVAIKVLPHHLAQDRTYVRRFKNEAEAAAKIRHPHIATIYDYGEADGQPYIVMEFLEGETLEDLLQKGALSNEEGLDIVMKIADGLSYAHENGVIHRDIKSGNIMVGPDCKVSLMDFGLAKMENSTMITIEGTILGTPAYMSPEQARGNPNEKIGKTSDIYSFGILMYEIFTGQLPFQAQNQLAILKRVLEEEPVAPIRMNPEIPIDLQTIILKAIEKTPARRYATMADLLDDLRRFRSGEPILAKPAGVGTKIIRKVKKAKSVFIVATVASVLVLLAVGFFMLRQKQIEKHHQRILKEAQFKLNAIQQEKEVLLGQLSQDPVFQVLKSNDPLARAQALVILNQELREKKLKGRLAEESFSLTLEALNDPHPLVRKHAAMLLGVLKDKRAVASLRGRINDEDAQVRDHTILALGLLDDKGSIDLIQVHLSDDDEMVRASSALALGILKARSATDKLIQALSDPFPKVRSDAAVALGSVEDERAIEPLTDLLKDPVAEVRNSAKAALLRFGDKARDPMLLQTLKNPDSTPEQIISVLQELDVKVSGNVFDEVLELLQHPDHRVRYHAVLLLGLFQKIDAVPHLIQALGDDDLLVRENARLSLIGITGEDFGYDIRDWKIWWEQRKAVSKHAADAGPN
ncbi:MAG: HEAT repeat domain-containing protein [Chlamydiota bacterium]|nr:HEAT repeat domain-containing protein [Chlamydiota bacterium]